MSLPFRIHIFGPDGVGKSTLAAALRARLAALTGIDAGIGETSEYLMQQESGIYCSIGGGRQNMQPTGASYAQRRHWLREKSFEARQALAAFGDYLTLVRPDCLIVGAINAAPLHGNAIIVGARRKRELDAYFKYVTSASSDVLIDMHPVDDVGYELHGYRPEGFTGPIFNTAVCFDDNLSEFAENIVNNLYAVGLPVR